ncbi:DNA oxidative demethylase AlkB [Bradyrhizobium sp. U87765 SZCCT0131]|nr:MULTISPECIES: DNA oxidative demethylase AlkB [unclassified Bradyrhizobium]MBR1308532.1 DNA oxidative demethylase AlkB [Bradyrhizobium sp. U87765 SZCCT0110]MBR1318067.1 DNA oxidative demethylase AlkB [Bradyrhizobium sp. U87765 SZCCT0109]MBR1219634.1 DNA oxidative demethylase AlkB [Bradyrhizobium sp. U87765 SZCCT0131]MBR1262285.1 DNA oxidative demethylase AlkB [Bradyrhizobium sp. U87765 SZCCT0134]MBR1351770.1 DNA oxidative demethylase AlkB [Bradyrhizobium sp. U87765 SZCCT0048]
MDDLFGSEPRDLPLATGAVVLGGFALPRADALLAALREVVAQAPFRHLITPGGYRMSVAMTNCGAVGWVSDRSGYRYDPVDPESGRHWPAMPEAFAALAADAATAAGFARLVPDACLINRYEPGAKLSLHQDKDELDLDAPIVSVSLGLPATFLFGGLSRNDRTRRVRLSHGDVVVWGGPARLAYHGVAPLPDGEHPQVGRQRLNLTFRKTR